MVPLIFSQAIVIFVDLFEFVESYIVVDVPNLVPKISSPKSDIVISFASSIEIAKSIPSFSADTL